MLTRDQLARLTLGLPAEDIAKLAGVSTKTIYRMREVCKPTKAGRKPRPIPNFETVQCVAEAVSKLKRRKVAA